ncbi:class I SAM-dependent methyltransferase [Staphylococcus simulans]|uniref:class I SAM-dependent methyltransferase n=1 Tax=Staphylococcus simulans TaxID=1286 RepID=UPI001E55A3E9|nr:class I SAM-dependent methyltransferase [Staphylococcus simulans]MCD8914334.1 class I SAM-dependent methyltransferase [Staphylococcus simulans]
MDTYASNNSKWKKLHSKSEIRNSINATIKNIVLRKSEILIDDNVNRILEIGCGFGRNLKYLMQTNFSNEYYGIDITSNSIKNCYKNLKYLNDNQNLNLKVNDAGEGIKFESNYFDLVFDIMSAITFIDNEKERNKYFSEVIRVLKPNGSYIFLCASNLGKFDDIFTDKDLFEKGYVKRKMDSMLEKIYSYDELVELLKPLEILELKSVSNHTRAFGDENFERQNGFWFGHFKKHK